MPGALLPILIISAIMLIAIGICLLASPLSHMENYTHTTGVVVQRSLSDAGGVNLLVEFEMDGKIIQRSTVNSVSGNEPSHQVGAETPIYYGKSRLLPIIVLMADEGDATPTRYARLYLITGITFLLLGFLMLIPIVLLLKKR